MKIRKFYIVLLIFSILLSIFYHLHRSRSLVNQYSTDQLGQSLSSIVVQSKSKVDSPTLVATEYKPIENSVESVVLAGDGGKLSKKMSTILTKVLGSLSSDRGIVYLGDNAYSFGLSHESRKSEHIKAKKVLDLQLAPVLQTNSKSIFIPGNHDWSNGRSDGWETIKRQGEYINSKITNGGFLPVGGCPGPVSSMITKNIQIIVFDSEWWLHRGNKPLTNNDGCPVVTKDQISAKFESIFRSTPKGVLSIFVTHHPLMSYGKHSKGDYCTNGAKCLEHIEMVQSLSKMLSNYDLGICAAGHDHSLQVIKSKNKVCDYYLVSGSLSKESKVYQNDRALFLSSALGFMIIDKTSDGQFILRVIEVDQSGRLEVVFTKNLFVH